jgi:riboflavin kinase / FMN adenylyltransferase
MLRFKGIVEKGRKLGTTLGYPTANIVVPNMEISGIYAARVSMQGKNFVAAAFADQQRKILEAFIFDFSDDLYGREIEITLEKKIREAKKFETDAELKNAIARDIEEIRSYFEI